jgi:hypothetical protein
MTTIDVGLLAQEVDEKLGFLCQVVPFPDPVNADGVAVRLPDGGIVFFLPTSEGWMKILSADSEFRPLHPSSDSTSLKRILAEVAVEWLDNYRYWVTKMNFPPKMKSVILDFEADAGVRFLASHAHSFLNQVASGAEKSSKETIAFVQSTLESWENPPKSDVDAIDKMISESEKAGEAFAQQMFDEIQRTKGIESKPLGTSNPSRTAVWAIIIVISLIIGFGAALGY